MAPRTASTCHMEPLPGDHGDVWTHPDRGDAHCSVKISSGYRIERALTGSARSNSHRRVFKTSTTELQFLRRWREQFQY